MVRKTLVINGVTRNLVLAEDETLAKVLREHLLLTGCKIGCGEGHCGACNIIMNGKVTKSCIVKMSKVPDNAEITTIEGVGTLSDMHPPAGCLDGPRLRPVRLLHPGLHHQRQGPAGAESEPDPRRGP